MHRGFRFSVHEVALPGRQTAREFERDIVHHPGAVAVVPLHDDGTVMLVRQYRAALEHGPARDPGRPARRRRARTTPRTAERELAEEAGLAAGRLEHLATFHNSPGFCDESVGVFLATGLRAVAVDRTGDRGAAHDDRAPARSTTRWP